MLVVHVRAAGGPTNEPFRYAFLPSGIMNREDELRSRVDDLYEIFGPYRLAARISPDPCFPGACDDRPLRAAPLRQLPPSAFQMYLWKAVSTWGSTEDFKHFLPRILEIVANPNFAGDAELDTDFLFHKLLYVEWPEWPRNERGALSNFFCALWKAVIGRAVVQSDCASYPRDALVWLGDLTLGGQDVDPLLIQWEEDMRTGSTSSSLAIDHFVSAVVTARDLIVSGSLGWNDQETQSEEERVLAWLSSSRQLQLLENAFFQSGDAGRSTALSDAHQCLSHLRDSRST